MKRILVAAMAAVCGTTTASAHASLPGLTLFDQADWAGFGSTYSKNEAFTESFKATANETTLAFYGYDVSGSDDPVDISMTPAAGGANLLGSTWSFTPAASGSASLQFYDGWGTGTNGLAFGGYTPGDFDEYYQTVATTIGQKYAVGFFLEGFGSPAEFVVTVNPGAAVPEPATWTLALIGFGAAGAALRTRRRTSVVA
ncbi:MAG TPA: PEPxxWA-CTERM sorting domain-containing protein [Caulobacteraceae bacterium]|jgi:hypothetical protein|nr:PEPxxWA-CTERM sorting domain-containing protein [Caulobacteraceae bacterium]